MGVQKVKELIWRLVPKALLFWLGTLTRRVSFSQHGEDEFVLAAGLLPDNKVLQLVEVGAFDGIRYSTTALIEQIFRSKTLLIEPSAHRASEARRLRRSAQVLCAAAGEQFAITSHSGDKAISGDTAFFSSRYRDRWKILSLPTYPVPVIPLSELLKSQRITDIDLLSIDVQGAELSVLRGLSPEVRISCILIELEGADIAREESCRALLVERGFTRVARLAITEVWVFKNLVNLEGVRDHTSTKSVGRRLRPYRTGGEFRRQKGQAQGHPQHLD